MTDDEIWPSQTLWAALGGDEIRLHQSSSSAATFQTSNKRASALPATVISSNFNNKSRNVEQIDSNLTSSSASSFWRVLSRFPNSFDKFGVDDFGVAVASSHQRCNSDESSVSSPCSTDSFFVDSPDSNTRLCPTFFPSYTQHNQMPSAHNKCYPSATVTATDVNAMEPRQYLRSSEDTIANPKRDFRRTPLQLSSQQYYENCPLPVMTHKRCHTSGSSRSASDLWDHYCHSDTDLGFFNCESSCCSSCMKVSQSLSAASNRLSTTSILESTSLPSSTLNKASSNKRTTPSSLKNKSLRSRAIRELSATTATLDSGIELDRVSQRRSSGRSSPSSSSAVFSCSCNEAGVQNSECPSCTCYLDPVELNDATELNFFSLQRPERVRLAGTVPLRSSSDNFRILIDGEQLWRQTNNNALRYGLPSGSLVGSQSLTALSSAEGGGQYNTKGRCRNKKQLTIDTKSGPQRTPGGGFSDPVYDLIKNSPIVKKLREFGFTYPGKERSTKRKLLLCLLPLIAIVVISIIVAASVVARNFAVGDTGSLSQNVSSQSSISTLVFPTSAAPRKVYSEAEIRELIQRMMTKFVHGDSHVTTKPAETTNQSQSLPETANQNATTVAPRFRETKTTKVPAVLTVWTTASVGGNSQSTENSKTITDVTTQTVTTVTTTQAVTTVTSRFMLPDWLPVQPETNRCQEDQFQCRSGHSRMPCLDIWERCDGIQDCSDGSDEEECESLKCFGTNFQCSNSQCVSLTKVCNGVTDCQDGSDELNCTNFNCKSYEYRCPSGYCIPHEWRCDGEVDCPDHADEYNCSQEYHESNEFLCPEGWFIPSAWQCNGVPDCADGQDEQNCDCGPEQFQCDSTGCVSKSALCNGVSDCADGSDEWNCTTLDKRTRVLQASVNENGRLSSHQICADNWNINLSHTVCVSLGKSKALDFDVVAYDGLVESKLLTLKNQQTNIAGFSDASYVQTLQSMSRLISKEQCASKGVVKLECENNECGSWPRLSNRYKRVIGGNVSANHEWPSVVLLFHTQKKWTCTASILSPHWLATSALCTQRTRDKDTRFWKVIAGSAQPYPEAHGESPDVVVRQISKLVAHPSYKFRTFLAYFDVMLVKLDRPLDLSGTRRVGIGGAKTTIASVCLPEAETVDRSTCITAGWGYTTPGGFSFNVDTVLRHVEMDIVSNEVCNSSDHYPGFITSNTMCARGRKDDWGPCLNDEGAPLMCQNKESGKWFLAGILTSPSCESRAKHPAIYADVFSMRQWIANTVGLTEGR